jgi:hypothetical protein
MVARLEKAYSLFDTVAPGTVGSDLSVDFGTRSSLPHGIRTLSRNKPVDLGVLLFE